MQADAGWWLGGYLGLGALVILLLRGVVSAYGMGWRHRPEPPRSPQTWRELQAHRQWAAFALFAWWIWPLAVLILIQKIMWPSQLDQNDRYIAQADDPQWPHHRGALRGLAVLRKRLVQAELVFESDHDA